MAVGVYESGSNDFSFRIDIDRRFGVRKLAYIGDTVPFKNYIGPVPGIAGTVDQPSVSDNYICHFQLLLCYPCTSINQKNLAIFRTRPVLAGSFRALTEEKNRIIILTGYYA